MKKIPFSYHFLLCSALNVLCKLPCEKITVQSTLTFINVKKDKHLGRERTERWSCIKQSVFHFQANLFPRPKVERKVLNTIYKICMLLSFTNPPHPPPPHCKTSLIHVALILHVCSLRKQILKLSLQTWKLHKKYLLGKWCLEPRPRQF